MRQRKGILTDEAILGVEMPPESGPQAEVDEAQQANATDESKHRMDDRPMRRRKGILRDEDLFRVPNSRMR